MRSLTARAVGLLIGLMAAMPAVATKYTYAITGTTVAPASDPLGIFYLPGTVLPAGEAFTLTYVVDDAVPDAIYSHGAAGSSADGGGLYQAGTTPPVTATLRIGSDTYVVRRGDSYTPAPVNGSGDPDGFETTEQDRGSARKSGASLSLAADYDKVTRGYSVAEQVSYGQDDDMLDVSLASAGFTSPDYRELGTFALTPGSGGLFLTSTYTEQHSGYVDARYTTAGLAATMLTVSSDAAPEPASWALMLTGFGAAGLSLRRARPSPPRPAGR